MSSINLFTVTTFPKTVNFIKEDIATKRAVIEEKLALKCREYDRWVEMRDKSDINKFKLNAYQILETLKTEIDELKRTLASFYKQIN